MTTGWDDLGPGDAVLLRFVSHFNEDVTHTVVGVIADGATTANKWAELVIEDEEDQYFVTWDGGVERRDSDGEFRAYGGGGRLWALDPVDHIVDDIPPEELSDGDKRPIDPLLDNEGNLADDIAYQDPKAEE